MATITGKTLEAIQEIEDALIESAGVDDSGHLTLTRRDSGVIDAGTVYAPTGAVVMFAGGVIPTGWLLCDGTAISRVTYSDLYTAIGTAYGTGDGVTTFNLPNMQAKFPRGDSSALGATGGSSTGGHTHTVANHTHTQPAHAHNLAGGSTIAHARIRLVTGTPGTLHMDRVVTPSWNESHTSDLSNAAGASGSGTDGVKLDGVTATAGADDTGSGGHATDSTGTLPSYLNFSFIIKT